MAQWRLFTEKDYTYSRIEAAVAEQPDEASRPGAATILGDAASIRQAVDQLRYLVCKNPKRSRFEHRGKTNLSSKIPRAHIWRSYRLSEADALLGVLCIKASEAFNLIEVDVFLAAEFPELPRLEITRQMLLFVLCDAVRCGTSLAIRFSDKCFGGKLPSHICELAQANGVSLEHAAQGAISPEEAKALFLKIAQFSDSAESRIREIDASGACSAERICYLTATGVWSQGEAEFILANAPYPEFVLGNAVSPREGLLFAQAQFDARSALLAESLYAAACRGKHHAGCFGVELVEAGGCELYVSRVTGEEVSKLSHPSENTVALVRNDESFSIPEWGTRGEDLTVAAGVPLIAHIRPYDVAFMQHSLPREFQAMKSASPQDAISQMVVPHDFHLLPRSMKAALINQATSHAGILVAPDLCGSLSSQVGQKMRQGEFVRS